jgi:alpha 1,2-mannosyltransferase
MGARRYYCFLFQVVIVAYIIGAAFYLMGSSRVIPTTVSTRTKNLWESLNSYKFKMQNDIPKFDPTYNNQPDSYTIDPPGHSFKMKVDLPPASNSTERQAAAFIVLVRNSELFGMIQSMSDVGKYEFNAILINKVTDK